VSFEDIAAAMSLSRGRVSQIHRSGLSRLRVLQKSQAGLSVSA
jgi:DNA-directed RNA polymerase sigma subunit (sigma70/sigma32)